VGDKSSHSLRIHLGLFAAEAICLSAFVIEISRALSGNVLSWAYVVEWPILGTYAVYMWHKLLAEESSKPQDTPKASEEEDASLRTWNDYLAAVHRHDQSDPS
jgi:hypothetical protein